MATTTNTGTYQKHPTLRRLPALVRKQRRLERRVARAPIAEEKATRDAIDALLVAAGFTAGQGVTCNGYDVVHQVRTGVVRADLAKLRAAGVAELDIAFATLVGKDALFATVRPEKGK